MAREVSQEEIKKAQERYPGLPLPLAISRYILDKLSEGDLTRPLTVGSAWGGQHLERVGFIAQKLAEAVYHQGKKSITIKMEAEDFPFDYDHWTIEITGVESPKPGEVENNPFDGWPCCACDKTIRSDDVEVAAAVLEKKAKWEYPAWGNVLTGDSGKAIAVLCGACSNAGKEATYAIKKEGEKFTRVPLSELEDV